MSEEKSLAQQHADFVNEMHDQFNKHGATLRAADAKLEKSDFKGFKELYANLTLVELIEIIQAQHLKINEIAYDREQAWETTLGIIRDISNCRDFVEFDKLRQKARSILLAQDMVDRGEDPEKIRKMMMEADEGYQSSGIILQ